MADLRRMTAMRRGGRYEFTRHRGSLNDRHIRWIHNRCTRERAVAALRSDQGITRDGARRIAANIAKLPEPLKAAMTPALGATGGLAGVERVRDPRRSGYVRNDISK
jgi:hypothetical protein